MAESPPPFQAIGRRMKEARLAAALLCRETVSQERMAEMVSPHLDKALAQAQWSVYERGLSEPPLQLIRAAARVSGLSPAYIAFGDNEAAAAKRGPRTQAELEAMLGKSNMAPDDIRGRTKPAAKKVVGKRSK